ncbi:MAG: hypothetical protein JWO40_824 [Candidatus Doudnabacteria bacterium]|nr:hypothetical protein [Candidatus Doudnabacteria bacterium]
MADLNNPAGQAATTAANEAIQEAVVGPSFLATIWIPYVSYIWSSIWLAEKAFKKNVNAEGIKINFFSRWQKITMIVLDLLWFLGTIFFLALVAQLVCHGDGSILGSISAWAGRTAIKGASLGQINFSFCSGIPNLIN